MFSVIFYLLLVIYFLVCLFLVLVILSQEGKGGGLSGMGGGSALGETFGFSGAETALRRWTRNVAITFVVLTLVLTFMGEKLSNRWSRVFSAGDAALPGAGAPGEVQPAMQPQNAVPPVNPGTNAAPGTGPAGAPPAGSASAAGSVAPSGSSPAGAPPAGAPPATAPAGSATAPAPAASAPVAPATAPAQ